MELSSIFCDGMVLQANKPIRVFGIGRGNVEIEFCGKVYKAESTDENWVVELAPEGYKTGLEMSVTLNGEKQVIRGVAVGEVLLVAGQSNVQLRVGEEKIDDPNYPVDLDLRFFAVDRLEEDKEAYAEKDGWKSVDADTVNHFSAVGYHLGAELRKRGVPVGVVACYQGASVIQSWLKGSLVDRFDKVSDPAPRRKTSIDCGYTWNENGLLYANMFTRIVPYAFSHVIWYQGESNAYLPEIGIYGEMFKTLVSSWRKDLRDENLPFISVVICDMDGQSDAFTAMQFAQRALKGSIDGVEIVESSDVCEHSTIHPNDKRLLCKRIAGLI